MLTILAIAVAVTMVIERVQNGIETDREYQSLKSEGKVR